MTEAEWLGDLDAALRAIEQFASVRQMRLVAAALVRRLEDCPLDDDEPKRCNDLIEAAADAPRPWHEVLPLLEARPGNWRFTHVLHVTEPDATAKELRKLVAFDAHPAGLIDHGHWLIREVVGNPFRRRAIDPGWLTPDVLALCEGLYERFAFERLPVLADALEDAGCTDVDLLGHLRLGGPHVRGCWALDLILGEQ
jgi:hypothetical protein